MKADLRGQWPEGTSALLRGAAAPGPAQPPGGGAVRPGPGRVAASHHRSSALYQVR